MSPAGTGPTVLVVDDERDVRTVARLMLKRAGYDVVEASNGREAVDAVAAGSDRIDVVLLDVMMPEMDGHTALPAMREHVADLPVVFFSGYGRSEVAVHLEGDGPYTSFLGKPFDKKALVAEIRRALEGTRP